ncbi:FERM domain-containing protein 5 [Homalodisca vitripennis]|nr:FERM domain-containing protein 5 [Homalodisca vitripennis]
MTSWPLVITPRLLFQTWENPTAAQDKEPQSRSDACEYSTAGAGPPVNGSSFNPDVRLSPGSPYSTSPASDDESSREKSILSEIKNLNESSLISNQTESEELDKNKVNTGPSLVGQGILLEPFYDHSPGEVYTIPEEEDEISSPTSGDGVTSLRKRRLVGVVKEEIYIFQVIVLPHFANEVNVRDKRFQKLKLKLASSPEEEGCECTLQELLRDEGTRHSLSQKGQMNSMEDEYGGDSIYSRTYSRPHNPALRSSLESSVALCQSGFEYVVFVVDLSSFSAVFFVLGHNCLHRLPSRKLLSG